MIAVSNYGVLTFPASLIGILPFFVGLGIAKRSSDIFEKKGTNITTFDDPDLLVTNGLYKISRNPMYLGFLIALFGLFILLGCLSALLVGIIIFIITDQWYIKFEEAAMAKVFGKQDAGCSCLTRLLQWRDHFHMRDQTWKVHSLLFVFACF